MSQAIRIDRRQRQPLRVRASDTRDHRRETPRHKPSGQFVAFASELIARNLRSGTRQSVRKTSHCRAGAWPVVPVFGVPVPLVLVPVPERRAIRRFLRPSCRATARSLRALRRATRRFVRSLRRS